MESGDHVIEFASVGAVEDVIEAMMGKLMSEILADAVAGACYEGSGVRAVTVAWERTGSRILGYKPRETDDKE